MFGSARFIAKSNRLAVKDMRQASEFIISRAARYGNRECVRQLRILVRTTTLVPSDSRNRGFNYSDEN